MKAHSEIARSVGPMRNLRHQQIVNLRVDGMDLDHALNDGAHELLERRCRVLDEHGLNHAIYLVDVALVQGGKDRTLVGEVLVKRADTYARNLSDAVGCDGLGALAPQKPNHRVEHSLDGLAGTTLLWAAPDRGSRCIGCHRTEHRTNVSKTLQTLRFRQISC